MRSTETSTGTEPATRQDVEGILGKLDHLLRDTDQLNTKLDQLQSRMNNIEDEMREIREEVDQNSKKVSDIETNQSVLNDMKQSLQQLQRENEQFRKEKDDLENRSRRNINLIFYGVSQEDPDESWSVSEEKVSNVIRNSLEIEDDIEFERCHRLTNARHVRGAKPIIAMLSKFKDKNKILANANKLRNSDLSIGEDFSKRLRAIHSKLIQFRKSICSEDRTLKANVRYDKLVCTAENGEKTVYKVDETTGEVFAAHRSR